MAEKTLKTRIGLKRDNLFNYQDTFVPLKGEICLVDTATSGLRVKCGDGSTAWSDLDFVDEILVSGFFIEGNFYLDSGQETAAPQNTNRIYVDLATAKLYIYNGTSYVLVGGTDTPAATAEVSGTVKLYDTVGANTDGTMSQYAITAALGKKVEVDIEDEIIIFNSSNLLG